MSILKGFAQLITGTSGPPDLRGLNERQLIGKESQIGRQLFGPIPRGHKREFFCLDSHTWIWYEEWTDEQGRRQHLNTRYEFRRKGILKIQGDRHYVFVSDEEAHNLKKAIDLYYKYVMAHVYNVKIAGSPNQVGPAHAV